MKGSAWQAVGFEKQQDFATVFRCVVGATPSGYPATNATLDLQLICNKYQYKAAIQETRCSHAGT